MTTGNVEQQQQQQETSERSIVDRMRENPEAFDFGNVQDLAERADGYKPTSLKTMTGGFTFAGKDFCTGVEFFGRKPKMKNLTALIEVIQAPIGGEGIELTLNAHTRMAEICSLLLYVKAGENWRSATVDEIAAAFDLAEMTTIKNDWSGFKAPEPGEA